ncbi:hypothetical protein CYMTET_26939 [Cymbomonas tetramitiformis]|uniref:Uncharacterized protein n=1 Tax=Cymbomonas tetramitiformis TaxID=36881 RepID=A0AAE0KXH7_9CHLO|nr:hypothetical protein CYMTET_26939 [Cymbomonas tetramitiformis]
MGYQFCSKSPKSFSYFKHKSLVSPIPERNAKFLVDEHPRGSSLPERTLVYSLKVLNYSHSAAPTLLANGGRGVLVKEAKQELHAARAQSPGTPTRSSASPLSLNGHFSPTRGRPMRTSSSRRSYLSVMEEIRSGGMKPEEMADVIRKMHHHKGLGSPPRSPAITSRSTNTDALTKAIDAQGRRDPMQGHAASASFTLHRNVGTHSDLVNSTQERLNRLRSARIATTSGRMVEHRTVQTLEKSVPVPSAQILNGAKVLKGPQGTNKRYTGGKSKRASVFAAARTTQNGKVASGDFAWDDPVLFPEPEVSKVNVELGEMPTAPSAEMAEELQQMEATWYFEGDSMLMDDSDEDDWEGSLDDGGDEVHLEDTGDTALELEAARDTPSPAEPVEMHLNNSMGTSRMVNGVMLIDGSEQSMHSFELSINGSKESLSFPVGGHDEQLEEDGLEVDVAGSSAGSYRKVETELLSFEEREAVLPKTLSLRDFHGLLIEPGMLHRTPTREGVEQALSPRSGLMQHAEREKSQRLAEKAGDLARSVEDDLLSRMQFFKFYQAYRDDSFNRKHLTEREMAALEWHEGRELISSRSQQGEGLPQAPQSLRGTQSPISPTRSSAEGSKRKSLIKPSAGQLTSGRNSAGPLTSGSSLASSRPSSTRPGSRPNSTRSMRLCQSERLLSSRGGQSALGRSDAVRYNTAREEKDQRHIYAEVRSISRHWLWGVLPAGSGGCSPLALGGAPRWLWGVLPAGAAQAEIRWLWLQRRRLEGRSGAGWPQAAELERGSQAGGLGGCGCDMRQEEELADLEFVPLIKSLMLDLETKELHLARNRFGQESLVALAELFRQRRDFVLLDLGSSVHLRAVGRNMGSTFLPSLSTCKSLQVLKLGNNHLGDNGVHALKLAIQTSGARLVVLELFRNGITSSGAVSLAELLNHVPGLTSLDVSWNQIRGAGACPLATAIGESVNLKEVNLAWNSMGEGNALELLADGLETNESITSLDLTHNAMKDAAATVLGKALHVNGTITRLVLNENPLGFDGGSYLAEVIHFMRRDRQTRKVKGGGTAKAESLEVEMKGCNMSQAVDNNKYFDPENPNKFYRLDLAKPYDRAIVRRLQEMASKEQGENWRGENIDGVMFEYDESKLNSFEWPKTGILELTYTSTPVLPDRNSIIHQEVVDSLDHQLLFESNDSKRAEVLMASFRALNVQSSQLVHLCSRIQARQHRERIYLKLWARLTDSDCLLEVIEENFGKEEADSAKEALGPCAEFAIGSPSGHYRLKLDEPREHMVASKLQEVGNAERVLRRNGGMADTSATGNYENWRNVKLNGNLFHYLGSWKIPTEGFLEFDYVSTTRPPEDCVPLMDTFLKKFMAEFMEAHTLQPTQVTLAFRGKKSPPIKRKPVNRLQAEAKIAAKLKMTSKKVSRGMTKKMEEKMDEIDDAVPETEQQPVKSKQRRMARKFTAPQKVEINPEDYPEARDSDTGAKSLTGLDRFRSAKNRVMMINKIMKDAKDAPSSRTPAQHFSSWITWWRVKTKSVWITCEQVWYLVKKFEEWAMTLLAVTQPSPLIVTYKLWFLIMFHSRLYDLCNFVRCMRDNLSFDHQQRVLKMVGVLNVVNIFDLDGRYQFDMSIKDEHNCARVLIDLAGVEPGNNMLNEMFNGYFFELPNSWEQQPPKRGIFLTTFHTPKPKSARPALRSQLCNKYCLLGSSPREQKMALHLAEKQNWVSPKIEFPDALVEEMYGLTKEEIVAQHVLQAEKLARKASQSGGFIFRMLPQTDMETE